MTARQPTTVAGDRLLVALSMLLPGWTHYSTSIAEVEDEAAADALARAADRVRALAIGDRHEVAVGDVLDVLARIASLAPVLFILDPSMGTAA